MADYPKPLPTPDPLTKTFWDSVKAHAMQLQQCGNCHKFIYYPRAVCPHCGSRDLSWKPVSGKGKVYGFTINMGKHPSVAAFAPDAPYVIGEADRDAGAAVFSLHRLSHADPERVKRRTGVETVHAAGHLLGLSHCSDFRCAMFLSRDAADSDRKGPGLCASCRSALGLPQK